MAEIMDFNKSTLFCSDNEFQLDIWFYGVFILNMPVCWIRSFF